MNRYINKYVLLILSFFIFSSASAANDKAFAWEVTSGEDSLNRATVYLIGSIHFADKSFYPLRPEIEDAFNRSKYLVVELDVNKIDSNVYNQLLSQKGTYKDGLTVKDVITDETWLQLRQRLRQLNIDYETVKHYKPGILVLTLSAIQITQMGFDAKLGIDAYFLSKASQQEQMKPLFPKTVIELETLEQQLNLFLNIDDDELLLKESLYSLDESELLMADMVRYWKQGDVVQMNKLLFEDALNEYPAFRKIYDKLFYERNRSMASKIDAMLTGGLPGKLQQKADYFVVVGSGHLVGEQGIVNELKEKGYRVKRL